VLAEWHRQEFFRDIIGDDFGQLKELLKGIARTVTQPPAAVIRPHKSSLVAARQSIALGGVREEPVGAPTVRSMV
jgi:hypothetical protein